VIRRRGLPFVAPRRARAAALGSMATMNTPTALLRALPALLAVSLWSAAPAWAQRFAVAPAAEFLAGDPVSIVLEGLPPGSELQLRSRRTVPEWNGALRAYAAEARFKADAAGRVDLAAAVPLPGGSYAGADLRGLFWSMAPAPTAEPAPAQGDVLLEARTADGSRVLATQTLRIRNALPDVQSREATPFPAARLFYRPGAAKRPALIVLGGSEGGTRILRDGPVWASRGYAVLALPYYSQPGWGPNGPTPAEVPALPAAFADIAVDRLEQVREWLAAQPEVDATRIGVMGTSKGAEFALLAGTRMPWIRAIVAVVPTDVVWEGWGAGVAPGTRSSFAWKGEPYAFVPYKDFDKEFAGFQTGADVKIRRPQDAGRAANPERVAPARIPVEQIAAPVLVIGGHDDQVWDSGGMAEAIVEARAAAGRVTEAVIDREAGHFLGGSGWGPTTQYNAGPSKSGGTPVANARTQARAWAATQDFLARNLGPRP
jgi:dienelactone hydrolase